jgi:hypothetical protein
VFSLSFQGGLFLIEQRLDASVGTVWISTTTRFLVRDFIASPLLTDV